MVSVEKLPQEHFSHIIDHCNKMNETLAEKQIAVNAYVDHMHAAKVPFYEAPIPWVSLPKKKAFMT